MLLVKMLFILSIIFLNQNMIFFIGVLDSSVTSFYTYIYNNYLRFPYIIIILSILLYPLIYCKYFLTILFKKIK